MVGAQIFKVYTSDWDTNHFGFKVAKAAVYSPANVKKVLDFCINEKVKFLVCRVPIQQIDAIHELENSGFLLMDTVINSCLDLAKWQPPSPLDLSIIRWGEEKDVDAVVRITREAFKNHIGHFHNDTKLDKEKCIAIYTEWARKSFHDRNLSVGVAVAEVGGEVAGYLTIAPPIDGKGDFGVGCVAPDKQGRGIFPKVYYFCLIWLKSQGATWVQDITQSTNYPELKVLMNVGFRPFESIGTFHRWFK
jgi:hypothetical protein